MIDVKVKATFKLEVKKEGSEDVIKSSEWSPNIVLDQGLNKLGTIDGYYPVTKYCRIGSGASTPAATQVQLDQQIAATGTQQTSSSGSNTAQGYTYIRITYRFPTGSAAGNISEVGVGWGTGVNTLFNRALIRDTSNNITTVTVLDDEVLDVTVELRSYVVLTPKSSIVTISDIDYDVLIQPLLRGYESAFTSQYYCSGASGYAGSIVDSTTTPSSHVGNFGVSNSEYVSGTLKRKFEIYWGLNTGNSAPLRTVVCYTPYASYQIQYNPSIPKTAETVLRLSYEVNWGRYE